MNLPVRLEEDLLQQILARLRGTAHPAREREDAWRVLPVKLRERVDVAGLAAGNQIRRNPVGPVHRQLVRR
jgi:hypothetical protein